MPDRALDLLFKAINVEPWRLVMISDVKEVVRGQITVELIEG
jgi:hypothetical protein